MIIEPIPGIAQTFTEFSSEISRGSKRWTDETMALDIPAYFIVTAGIVRAERDLPVEYERQAVIDLDILKGVKVAAPIVRKHFEQYLSTEELPTPAIKFRNELLPDLHQLTIPGSDLFRKLILAEETHAERISALKDIITEEVGTSYVRSLR